MGIVREWKRLQRVVMDMDLFSFVIIVILDTKFLLWPALCFYRAGTRDVHNKLEKNRWVQPVSCCAI